jgi:O-succinylbenzoic acid--CoA ligase
MKLFLDKQRIDKSEILDWARAYQGTEEWLYELASFLIQWFDTNDFVNCMTSGSTGTPRLFKASKIEMIQSAERTIQYFHLDNNTRAVLPLSCKYIGGKMMLVRSLVGSFDLVVQKPSSNPLSLIHEEVDFIPMTPHQLAIGHSESLTPFNYIKTILLGGAPVPYQLEEQIQDLSTAIYQGYGMTETLSHIAIRSLNGSERRNFYEVMDGIEISMSVDNCLIISLPGRSDKIYTKDIVKLKDERSFSWLGRQDHVINSGGIKIYPEEIERLVSTYISQPYLVSSIPDSVLGEKLILIVEEADNPEEDLLKDIPQDVLYGHKRPKAIYYLDTLEYTENGKKQRKLTRDKLLRTIS